MLLKNIFKTSSPEPIFCLNILRFRYFSPAISRFLDVKTGFSLKSCDSVALHVSFISAGFGFQPQLGDLVQDHRKQTPRDRHFGQLERHVLCMPDDLRADLDELLPNIGILRFSARSLAD